MQGLLSNTFGGSDVSIWDLLGTAYSAKTTADSAETVAKQRTAQIIAQGNAQVAAENTRAVQFTYLAIAGIAASLLILLIKYKAI